MPTISPQRPFAIAYLIGDTADASLYYVQAVIRNTLTNAVLSTTNLTRDSGNSRRFYGAPVAPADMSGLGFGIDVTVTVYTDSGYTVKSALYPESLNTYIVQDRANTASGGGGGENDGETDKKLLAAITRLGKDIKNISKQKAPIVDLGSIKDSMDEMESRIIESLPEPEKVSFEATHKILEDVKRMISEIPKPDKFIPTDLSKLEGGISGLVRELGHVRTMLAPQSTLGQVLSTAVADLTKVATGIREEIKNTAFNVTVSATKDEIDKSAGKKAPEVNHDNLHELFQP